MRRFIALLAIAIASAAALHAAPEIKVQLGHSTAITSVALSPDGKYALSGSGDHTARLWDIATGRELRAFVGHSQEVCSVAFSPDGRLALTGSMDSTVRLWDIATGRIVRVIEQGNCADSVAFSPDGRSILSSEYHDLKLWDADSGRLLRTFTGHKESVEAVAISPDGRQALSASSDKTLKLWDLATGRELRSFAGHRKYVRSVAFTPDGKRAVSGSWDETFKLWDLSSGKELRSFDCGVYVDFVCLSPDGRYALSRFKSFEDFALWDLSTGEPVRTFEGDDDTIEALAFSPDGRFALSGSERMALKLWDLAAGKELRSYRGYTDSIDSVSFSPDGRSIVSGSRADLIRLVDAATGKVSRVIEQGNFVDSVVISPDGRSILSSEYHDLKLWDAASGQLLRTFTGHTDCVNAVAISPDGRQALSASSDKTLKLWDLASGKMLRSFVGHSNYVTSVAFAPDGKYAVSGSWDHTVKRWEISSGKVVGSFDCGGIYVAPLCLSPDGRYALSRYKSYSDFALLNLATGEVVRTFEGHADSIESLAFSPDGRCALSGSEDTTIKLWDIATGKEIRTFAGHVSDVKSVAFSPDGSSIVSGGIDGVVRRWNCRTGELAYSTISTADGRSLAWTPDGYFSGDDLLAQEAVFVLDGFSVYGIGQFFDRFHRPDIIEARSRGEDTSRLAAADLTKGFARPPLATIALSSLDSATGRALVSVGAVAQGGGVDGVRLYLNGKAVGDDVRGLQVVQNGPFRRDFTVMLAAGENSLRAVAFSGDRTESAPAELSVAYAPAKVDKPVLYVLLAAADAYRNGAYNLNFAMADAQGFADAVTPAASRIFSRVDLRRVVGAELSQANLIKALDEIGDRAKPQDAFIFFYAGHGVALDVDRQNVFYFVLPGVTVMNDPERLRKEGFSTAELRERVGRIAAGKQLLLVDACNSGALAEGFARRGAAEENALAQLQRSSGVAVFSASTDRQYANEVKEIGHGLFTWALIQGLKGAAANAEGKITAASLKAYIDDAVPSLALKYHGAEQFPFAMISGQDFPIGLR
jgi:WD40 repeat protein